MDSCCYNIANCQYILHIFCHNIAEIIINIHRTQDHYFIAKQVTSYYVAIYTHMYK